MAQGGLAMLTSSLETLGRLAQLWPWLRESGACEPREPAPQRTRLRNPTRTLLILGPRGGD